MLMKNGKHATSRRPTLWTPGTYPTEMQASSLPNPAGEYRQPLSSQVYKM
jgi:hypothetical protein